MIDNRGTRNRLEMDFDVVYAVARSMWEVADTVDAQRIDEVLWEASSAAGRLEDGTEWRSLRTQASAQRSALAAISEDLNLIGTQIRKGTERIQSAEERFADSSDYRRNL